ncbi:MAG: BlaI/MecI/CopY family transcriptional regulator [Hymenobacter sp.]
MQLMLEKGLVQRDDEGRSHIYRAAVREQATQGLLLDKFVEATFRRLGPEAGDAGPGPPPNLSRRTGPDSPGLLNDIEIQNANTLTPNSDDDAPVA